MQQIKSVENESVMLVRVFQLSYVLVPPISMSPFAVPDRP